MDSEGTRTPGKVFSVGSGSVYAFGVLDSGYRWDLEDLEAQGKLCTTENLIIYIRFLILQIKATQFLILTNNCNFLLR